jgi:predicted LPLAT superfamily acyltransferase
MADMAAKFAAELERVLRLYPTQWFNFYDFWKE